MAGLFADKLAAALNKMLPALQRSAGSVVRVLGPAEAPLAVVRGRHRFRLMVKSARNFDLSAYMRAWLERAPKRMGDIKLDVDVDPQSFL